MGAPAVATPKRSRPKPRTTKPKARPSAAAARPQRATGAPPRRDRAPRSRSSNVIRFPVTAVGRTAGAVGDIADSGVVVGISRGRAWIMVVGLLLGGIVAVNVLGLSLSAAGSDTALKIDALQRQNSVLEGRNAHRLSNDKVSAVANRLGLAVPPAGDVGYLSSDRNDVAAAARRLAAGEITTAAPVAADPALEETASVSDPVVEPSLVDPAAAETPPPADPVVTEPVEPVQSTSAEATPAAPVTPSSGGGLEAGGAIP